MRDVTSNLCPDNAGNSVARSMSVPRLAGFTATALTLPVVGEQPGSYRVVSTRDWWSRVAVTLLDAGVIDPSMITPTNIDPAEIATEALERWTRKRLGELRYIGLKLALSDSAERAVGVDGLDPAQMAEARCDYPLLNEKDTFFLSNIPTAWGFVCISQGYAAMEQRTSGLGQTVWYHMQNWLGLLHINAMTADRIEDLVRNYEWYGEDDESEVIDQFENIKEFEESGHLTRAEFDKLLPPFFVKPKPLLTWDQLRKFLDAARPGDREAELVDRLFQCRTAIGTKGFKIFSPRGILLGPYGEHAEQISPSVFVRWTKNDRAVEFFDNFAENYQQGGEGYYEGAMGFDCIPVDGVKPFCKWLRQADAYFRTVSLLDQMLAILDGYNQ